jgi:hypothetical protein
MTPAHLHGPLDVTVHSAGGPLQWFPVLAVFGALAVSAWSLYLSYRSRISAARDQLHAEQVRLVLQYMYPLLNSAILCQRILAGQEHPGDSALRGELKEKIQELVAKAHAVLPDEICAAMWDYMLVVIATLGPRVPGTAMPTEAQLGQTFSRFLRLVRSQLGIDALSREAVSLFGGAKGEK